MQTKFNLDFNTDNAAFGDDKDAEIIRILREVATQIETESPTCRKIYDINGNGVGTWRMLDYT